MLDQVVKSVGAQPVGAFCVLKQAGQFPKRGLASGKGRCDGPDRLAFVVHGGGDDAGQPRIITIVLDEDLQVSATDPRAGILAGVLAQTRQHLIGHNAGLLGQSATPFDGLHHVCGGDRQGLFDGTAMNVAQEETR